MKMKAAIIGGGVSGQSHVKALKACGVETAAVITTRRESAEDFAKRWNIPCWGTDLSLAFSPDIDAVHICTPPATHGDLVLSLLKHGKNVLCEKPLCFDREEGRMLAQVARDSGLVCAVTFNVRYHMACQKAKELIASGQFGRPLLIHGNYMQEFHALPAPLGWRYDPKLAGEMRAVTEIGSHWLDLAQYISGKKVTAVSALFGNFHPDRIVSDGMMYPADPEGDAKIQSKIEGTTIHVDSEDAAVISLKYEDGAIGSLLLSEVSPGRGNRLTLEITCEDGNLWWNEEDNNILHTAKKGEGIRTEVFAFGNGFSETFQTLLERYYGAIERKSSCQEPDCQKSDCKTPDWPTFEEGAQITSICCALAESAAQNSRWVAI